MRIFKASGGMAGMSQNETGAATAAPACFSVLAGTDQLLPMGLGADAGVDCGAAGAGLLISAVWAGEQPAWAAIGNARRARAADTDTRTRITISPGN